MAPSIQKQCRHRPRDAADVVVRAATARLEAAGQLVRILGTLSKRTQRRGKLAAVRSMTTSWLRCFHDLAVPSQAPQSALLALEQFHDLAEWEVLIAAAHARQHFVAAVGLLRAGTEVVVRAVHDDARLRPPHPVFELPYLLAVGLTCLEGGAHLLTILKPGVPIGCHVPVHPMTDQILAVLGLSGVGFSGARGAGR